MAVRPKPQFDRNIAFFAPAGVAFPGVSADRKTLRSLLEPLDLTEVLFTATRLNLILSDKVNDDPRDAHWSIRHQDLQSALVLSFFNEEQVDRIDAYIKASKAGPGDWQVFFRGQSLELIRQACIFCSERPDAPKIETDSTQRARFSEAALIASELWSEIAVKIHPPTNAPMIPKMMSRISPSPVLLTISLPMKPAISPTTSHEMMPIVSSRVIPRFRPLRSGRMARNSLG
jgi:hypothetical protein